MAGLAAVMLTDRWRSMVSALTHWIKVLWSYALSGEAGLLEIQERLHDAAHEQPEGKLSKNRAMYLPQAPVPATIWPTRCGRCRFWQESEDGEAGRCHIVGQEDDRAGGEAIHYRGWCAFWMPTVGEPAFAWLKDRVRPEGRSSVRGRWDPEPAVKERQRDKRITEPPPEPEIEPPPPAGKAPYPADLGGMQRGD